MRHLKRKVAAIKERAEFISQIIIKEEELIKEEDYKIKEEDSYVKNEEGSQIEDIFKEESKKSKIKAEKLKNSTKKDSPGDHLWENRCLPSKTETTKKHAEPKAEKGSTSAKNIIKNYGRALHNFAISNMVLPYIDLLLEKENVTLKDFRKFLYSKKKQVRSIAGLRNLLLTSAYDDKETSAFKRIFQQLSIIFIKYFSVNWIFAGKLLNKIAHLKCRFKMLRRIKDPENFTYLKGFL